MIKPRRKEEREARKKEKEREREARKREREREREASRLQRREEKEAREREVQQEREARRQEQQRQRMSKRRVQRHEDDAVLGEEVDRARNRQLAAKNLQVALEVLNQNFRSKETEFTKNEWYRLVPNTVKASAILSFWREI